MNINHPYQEFIEHLYEQHFFHNLSNRYTTFNIHNHVMNLLI